MNKQSLKYILGYIAICFVALAYSCTSHAQVVRGFDASCTGNGKLDFLADSIDYRTDLTRIYGRLIGTPHTSNRIDNLTLIIDGTPYEFTDLDGVDPKRYFQWEDDGVINIEIDFPALKSHPSHMVIKTLTPYGESSWALTRRANKKR